MRQSTNKIALKQSPNEELLNLLVNQLGVKPSVLFPNVNHRTIQMRQSRGP